MLYRHLKEKGGVVIQDKRGKANRGRWMQDLLDHTHIEQKSLRPQILLQWKRCGILSNTRARQQRVSCNLTSVQVCMCLGKGLPSFWGSKVPTRIVKKKSTVVPKQTISINKVVMEQLKQMTDFWVNYHFYENLKLPNNRRQWKIPGMTKNCV